MDGFKCRRNRVLDFDGGRNHSRIGCMFVCEYAALNVPEQGNNATNWRHFYDQS